MRKFLVWFSAVTALLGPAALAGATTVYTDIYDPEDLLLSATGTASTTWTFDIIDNGYQPGFEEVQSAIVTMHLCDDKGQQDYWESAELQVGENVFDWTLTTQGPGPDGDVVSFVLTSLMELSATGRVVATITATYGDFYFNDATLAATAEPVATVPVPGALLLVGPGLGVLAAIRRKNRF